MKILGKDDILNINDVQKELVKVPEWGGEVWVRGLTGSERDAFEGSVVETRGKNQRVNMTNVRAKLAALSMCDETGKRLFTEKDAYELGKKSASALQRIFAVAQKLSGIGEDEIGELTEAVKDNPFGDSHTD